MGMIEASLDLDQSSYKAGNRNKFLPLDFL